MTECKKTSQVLHSSTNFRYLYFTYAHATSYFFFTTIQGGIVRLILIQLCCTLN